MSLKTNTDLNEADDQWAPCRKTTGTIGFIASIPQWEREKPFVLSWPLPRNQTRSNCFYEAHDLQIADVRGREDKFSLDVQGFAFAKMPASDTTRNKEAIETEYLSLVETWLKQFLGAEKVVAFDYTVGHALSPPLRPMLTWKLGSYGKSETSPQAAIQDRIASFAQLLRTHTRVCHDIRSSRTLSIMLTRRPDQTPEAALSRLRLYFKNEADSLIYGRVRFVK